MSEQGLSSLDLRRAIRAKFAWPGGYCLLFVTDDGATLCADCCRAEYRQIANARRHALSDGWRVVAISNGSECDGSQMCDHCSAELGAYAPEPEPETEEPAPCTCGSDEAEQRPCICALIASDALAVYSAPSHWASYLVNGDASGLEDSEQRDADQFLERVALGAPVDCREAGFMWSHDAGRLFGLCNLGADCARYYFTAAPSRDAADPSQNLGTLEGWRPKG